MDARQKNIRWWGKKLFLSSLWLSHLKIVGKQFSLKNIKEKTFVRKTLFFSNYYGKSTFCQCIMKKMQPLSKDCQNDSLCQRIKKKDTISINRLRKRFNFCKRSQETLFSLNCRKKKWNSSNEIHHNMMQIKANLIKVGRKTQVLSKKITKRAFLQKIVRKNEISVKESWKNKISLRIMEKNEISVKGLQKRFFVKESQNRWDRHKQLAKKTQFCQSIAKTNFLKRM